MGLLKFWPKVHSPKEVRKFIMFYIVEIFFEFVLLLITQMNEVLGCPLTNQILCVFIIHIMISTLNGRLLVL